MFVIPWWQIGYAAAHGLLAVVYNPLLYLAYVLLLWDLHRQARFERRLFGVRLTRVWSTFGWLWLQGLVAGCVLSVLAAIGGVTLDAPSVWIVTGLTIVIGAVRPRWSPSTVAVGVLVIVGIVVRMLPQPILNAAWQQQVWTWLQQISISGWLGLASLSCLVEALCLWLNRRRFTSPLLIVSKRGRTMGGYASRLVFVAPVLGLTSGSQIQAGHLSWIPDAWPWLGGPHANLALLGLPLLFGFNGLFASSKPQVNMGTVSFYACVTGVLAGCAAFAAHNFDLRWGILGCLALWAGRAVAHFATRRRESRSEPLYTTSPFGVKVLGIMKGSLAESMGILPGERITHVNQVPVNTAYDFHFAMDQNPAYAKIQVFDERGVARIIGRPVYAGGRVKLGLVLVPDLPNHPACRPPMLGLFETLWIRMTPLSSPAPTETRIETVSTGGA